MRARVIAAPASEPWAQHAWVSACQVTLMVDSSALDEIRQRCQPTCGAAVTEGQALARAVCEWLEIERRMDHALMQSRGDA